MLRSISAFAYLTPSLVPRPTVPRSFAANASIDPDLIGASELLSQSLSAYVLSAMCDLSDLLHRIMVYNDLHIADLNTECDIDVRMAFYKELLERIEALPLTLRADADITLETCFLR